MAKITGEQAVKVLQKERDEKVNACMKEVQEVLDKHGCILDYQPQIRIVLKS